MTKLFIITIFFMSFLFANETFRSIEELSPNDKQIKEMIEKKQLEEEKSSLFEKVILPELEIYGERKSYFKNKTNSEIIHKIEAMYEINENEILFLISSSFEKFDCHSCIAKMSWFHLKKEKNKWNIKNKILNRNFQFGAWGIFSIPELIKIGENDIAFKYIFTYGQGGYSNTTLLIESFKNGKFNKILTDEFAYNDTGVYEINEEHNNWESKLTIINKNKMYYDILIEKQGLKDLKKFYIKYLYVYKNNKYERKVLQSK